MDKKFISGGLDCLKNKLTSRDFILTWKQKFQTYFPEGPCVEVEILHTNHDFIHYMNK